MLRDVFQRFAKPRQAEALPVLLERRRIYVLPTRFGLMYSALVLTMLVGALNYNNNPALLLGLLLAVVGLTSLMAGHLQLSGLSIIALDADPVRAGQALQLHVHAHSEDARPRQGLLVQAQSEGEPHGFLHLTDSKGMAELALPTLRRGWMALPRLRISTTRPLGLALCWAYVLPQQRVLVYPTPEADGPPLPSGDGQQQRSRPQRSGEDLHQLREYRRGDARHAIAWKPSARHASLLVREHEQPQGTELVLDWHSLQGLDSEARIRRLARWVDQAERENRPYLLRVPGSAGIGPDVGPQHRHACLRALALLPAATSAGASA